MTDIDQERRKLRAAPFVAACRQRAQRVPVIALTPRDDVGALRLADLNKILARQFDGGFSRFRPAGH